jgi:hypothetical protein
MTIAPRLGVPGTPLHLKANGECDKSTRCRVGIVLVSACSKGQMAVGPTACADAQWLHETCTLATGRRTGVKKALKCLRKRLCSSLSGSSNSERSREPCSSKNQALSYWLWTYVLRGSTLRLPRHVCNICTFAYLNGAVGMLILRRIQPVHTLRFASSTSCKPEAAHQQGKNLANCGRFWQPRRLFQQ